jgi:hypothetical protein
MTGAIVFEPGVRFDTIAACFADWEGGATDQHLWIADEPIGARWRRGEEEVVYSANPAINLRVLSGDRVSRHADRLPVLTPARARSLVLSAELDQALLGITACGLHGDLAAVEELTQLAGDERPEVGAAAELALQRIGVASFALADDRIAERRRRLPDQDPVFGLAGSHSMRRQLVRWLAVDAPADRRRQVALVTAALRDDDWEVRWSAVIAAYELGLRELVLEIKRCQPADEAPREDRQILEALRDVVGWHLVGGESERGGAEHLRACLAGNAERHDRAFLLVTALRRPLPVATVRPSPPGFCTVPTILHWLGDPEVTHNPLRAVVPRSDFSITETLRGVAARDDVTDALAELSESLRLPLRLPTAEELELAVRGPDGRRYPWGNGRERRARRARSPWGLQEPLAEPEWVEREGHLFVLGGADPTCAGPLRTADTAALRPVIDEG